MALFTTYDGVDSAGNRAEVNVQTGTGRVKDVVGRGNPSEDGVYRNVEVVFDPDNPLLKRKVYAMLDTTAKELHAYVEAAHADQRTVSYRIESQRKRGVDRSVPFAELRHAEQVVRILAAVDDVFSHEAKTDPLEDPGREDDNPSALMQRLSGGGGAATSSAPGPVDADGLAAAWVAARDAGVAQGVLDSLAAQALAGGADPALFVAQDVYGSAPVLAAARAEQFALDHLVSYYSMPPTELSKPRRIVVVDAIFAQAAAMAVELLKVTDAAQVAAGLTEANRFAGSYRVALDLVCDCVEKRHSFPLGQASSVAAVWREVVAAEAGERLRGIGMVAEGVVPHNVLTVEDDAVAESKPARKRSARKPKRQPEVPEPQAEVQTEASEPQAEAQAEVQAEAPEPQAEASEPQPEVQEVMTASSVAAELDAEIVAEKIPAPGDPGFVAPDDELVNRLRDLCIAAKVTDNLPAVSQWLAANTGRRYAREIHAPKLVELVESYESSSPDALSNDVLAFAA